MNRKEICAFLMKCEPDSMMAYTDFAAQGCTAVGPDGRKFRFSVEQLERAEPPAKSTQGQAEPKAKPKASKPAPSSGGTARKRSVLSRRKKPVKKAVKPVPRSGTDQGK